jgi:hypothetical protein
MSAEALRRELQQQGLDASALERTLENMRELESARTLNDPQQAARLQADVIEGLKAFEFALRRQVEGDRGRPVVGGNADVPVQFKQLVEEYYKSLAKKPQP